MRHNLGKVEVCESRVITRLRYVHKQEMEMPGSQRQEQDLHTKQLKLEVYVVNVSIKLNVQNGESITKSSVSGVV